ncbi:MAG: MFS transporter [Chloroflexota bacterium]|nr:MFS transporter [Chloroflexota bacterium]
MRISPMILAVYLPTALLAFGQGSLLATLPLFADDFGVSYELVSLVVGAAAIGTLAMDLPAGVLLHRLGLRPAMIIGCSLVAVSTLALVVVQDFSALVVFRILAGVGTALWALSRHAYITEAIPAAQRGQAISTFGGINRIGVFGGPVLGGIIGTALGLRASFALSAGLACVALVMAIVLIRPVPKAAESLALRHRWGRVGTTLKAAWRDFAAASVAQTFAQMVRAGRHLIIPLYAQDRLGLDAAQIGLILSISAIADVSMFVPAGFLMDRFGRKVASVPSFAIMAVGVACIPFTADFTGLMLAGIVIGLGNGLGSGAMMTLGADMAPPGATGEFLGIWRLIGDAGGAAGPLAVGIVAGSFGLVNGAYVLAGLGLAASLTIALLVRETRQAPLT